MKKANLKVGDIVTCSQRKSAYLFRVVGVTPSIWTAQQAQYGYCDVSDIGKPYSDCVKLQAIFELTVKSKKMRKVTLNADTWYCQKVEPAEVFEFIQQMNKFLTDTWP